MAFIFTKPLSFGDLHPERERVMALPVRLLITFSILQLTYHLIYTLPSPLLLSKYTSSFIIIHSLTSISSLTMIIPMKPHKKKIV